MKKFIAIIFVGVLLASFGSNLAFADWSQSFMQSSTETYFGVPVGTFDRMGIWWESGDKFASPAFTNFSDAGWNNVNVSDTYAYAIGSSSNNLTFNISFLGLQSAGTKFYFMAALGDDIRQRQVAIYDGTNWNVPYGVSFPDVSPGDWKGPASVVTPEPISSVLFLLGGGVIAGFARLRKKAS